VSGYAADSKGNVFPLATCSAQQRCFTTHLPVASTPGGLDFVMYGTGLRGASGRVRMRIGTYTVESVDIVPHGGYSGVDDLRFHLPQDFPLHLYQTISAVTPEGKSSHLWIYLDSACLAFSGQFFRARGTDAFRDPMLAKNLHQTS